MKGEEPFLQKVAVRCLWSAKSHLRSAQTLASESNYGHALGHLVISREELGKGLAYRLVVDELARIEGAGRARSVLILPGALNLRFNFYRHPEKTALNDGMVELLSFATQVVIAAALGLWSSGQTTAVASTVPPQPQPEPSPEAVRAGLKLLVEEMKKASHSWREGSVERNRAKDRLKQRGFYVDEDGGVLSTPSDITKEVYEKELEELRSAHKVAGPFVAEPIMDVLMRRAVAFALLGFLATGGASKSGTAPDKSKVKSKKGKWNPIRWMRREHED